MKMESELPSAWEKLAAACRKSRAGLLPVNEEAPFGFAQRIAAQALSLRQNERLVWWTRWSMRASAVAGMTAAALALRAPAGDSEPVLFAAPALEVPSFSAP